MQTQPKNLVHVPPIDAIWELRRCGEPAAAEEEYLKLKRTYQLSLRIEDWKPDSVRFTAVGYGLQDLIEMHLLKISFMLRGGSLSESDRQMKELNKLLVEFGGRRSYQFEFQAAAISYVRGDYSSAHQGFARASELAIRGSYQLPKARLNKMLAMESLGILRYEDLESFKSEVASQRSTNSIDDEFLHQLVALEMRHRFNSRSVGQLLSKLEISTEAEQAQFYAGWMSQLAYLQKDLDRDGTVFNQALQSLAQIKDGYRARFRLHTLLCNPEVIDVDIEAQPGAADLAERLYLWTWHWLQDPGSARAESLIRFAQQSLNSNINFRETDRILVTNAISWLLLFSGHNPSDYFCGAGDSGLLRSSLSVALRLESRLLSGLRWHEHGLIFDSDLDMELLDLTQAAQKQGYDSLAKIALHLAGMRSDGEHQVDPRFEMLHHAIESMLYSEENKQQTIRLRMMTGCVNVMDSSQSNTVRLPRLASVLALMAQRGYASTTEVALLALNLSIRAMDDSHARIDKVLWRANKELGQYLMLTRRGSVIFLETKYRISVDIPTRYQSILPFSDQIPIIASTLIRSQGQTQTESQPEDLKPSSQTQRMCRLSRRDLELALKVSRPTANRLLRSWLDDGKIQKVEGSPLPTYEISTELLSSVR